MMNLRDQLMHVTSLYAEAASKREKPLSVTSVSTRIFGDGKTLGRLASDHTARITTDNFERAIAWFSANWPEGLAWPAGVVRPKSPTEAA